MDFQTRWPLLLARSGQSWLTHTGQALSVGAGRALTLGRASGLRMRQAWLARSPAWSERGRALSSRAGRTLSNAAGRIQSARVASTASQVSSTAAGMLGIFPMSSPALRITSLVILGACALLLRPGFEPQLAFALPFFGLVFMLRYRFLFASFRRGGIAPQLTQRYGRERGFELYQAISALLLFAQRLGFFWLLLASHGQLSGLLGVGLMSSGCFLITLGVGISVWAAHTLGLGAYYYADLFAGERVRVSFEGPYSAFRDPMYSVGKFAAYGCALIAVSPIGLLAVAFDQFAMYAFNSLVEQPHLQAAQQLPPRVAVPQDELPVFDAGPPGVDYAYAVDSLPPPALQAASFQASSLQPPPLQQGSAQRPEAATR